MISRTISSIDPSGGRFLRAVAVARFVQDGTDVRRSVFADARARAPRFRGVITGR